MINELVLRNFKCFSKQEFKLSGLTVFCGANSAGKSTAIQSILSLKQNLDFFSNFKYRVNGELFSFGKFKDLLSHNPVDEYYSISLNAFSFRIYLDSDDLDKKEFEITSDGINSLASLKDVFSNSFVYLCAERFGPRSSFEVSEKKDQIEIGIYGQFALSSYYENQDQKAKNPEFAKRIMSHLLKSEDETVFLDALVKEAMRRIYPSFSMSVIEAEEIDRVYNLYKSGAENIRPINIGFGVSYVLPIIISASLIEPGGTLIVENPEVHLHPGAQSELVKVLCELSKSGVQVILETHSDHIVNGIRVFAKENDFSEDDNVIYSISGDSENKSVTEIHIDSDGNLSALDEGFFDQINKDLMRLF